MFSLRYFIGMEKFAHRLLFVISLVLLAYPIETKAQPGSHEPRKRLKKIVVIKKVIQNAKEASQSDQKGNYVQYVNNLRKEEFEEDFRQEFLRALSESENSILINPLGVPEGNSLSLDLPLGETLGEKISKLPETRNSRTNERRTKLPGILQGGAELKTGTEAKRSTSEEANLPGLANDSSLESNQNEGVTTGLPTIIRSSPTPSVFSDWDKSDSAPPERIANTERSFKKFEPYLNEKSTPSSPEPVGKGKLRKFRKTVPTDSNLSSQAKTQEVWVWVEEGVNPFPGEEHLYTEIKNPTGLFAPIKTAMGEWSQSLNRRILRVAHEPFGSWLTHWMSGLALILLSLMTLVMSRKTKTELFPQRPGDKVQFYRLQDPHEAKARPRFSFGLKKNPPSPRTFSAWKSTDSSEEEITLSQDSSDDDEVNRFGSYAEDPTMEFNDDVRVAFDPRIHRWVLKKRNPATGFLGSPLAELKEGTVVRGVMLSTKDSFQRYKLLSSGSWVPTDEKEQIVIAVRLDHLTQRQAG